MDVSAVVDDEMEPTLTTASVVVSRNGAVRLRAQSSLKTLFGWVIRDPRNRKRWIARNGRGLPIGRHFGTRREALQSLTEYTENTVLSSVPAEEHISATTEPIMQFEPVRRVRAYAAPIVAGIAAIIPGALLLHAVFVS